MDFPKKMSQSLYHSSGTVPKTSGFWTFFNPWRFQCKFYDTSKCKTKKPSEIFWILIFLQLFQRKFWNECQTFKLCPSPHHQQPYLGALNLRSLAGSHICQQLIPRYSFFGGHIAKGLAALAPRKPHPKKRGNPGEPRKDQVAKWPLSWAKHKDTKWICEVLQLKIPLRMILTKKAKCQTHQISFFKWKYNASNIQKDTFFPSGPTSHKFHHQTPKENGSNLVELWEANPPLALLQSLSWWKAIESKIRMKVVDTTPHRIYAIY